MGMDARHSIFAKSHRAALAIQTNYFLILSSHFETFLMIGQSGISFSRTLFDTYGTFRLRDFSGRHFQPKVLHDVLRRLGEQAPGVVSSHVAGASFEGRPIYHISAGAGPVSILLWSQMHGDESTATMAIADILNYLVTMKGEEPSGQILSSLTLHFLPMLNPDGAARCQRRTAQGIDMNRDALALVTPEARILRQLQAALHPQFAFNLHDQELSTVGSSRELAAIGLLAPAFDEQKSDNDVRRRARHLASIFAVTMREFAEGKIARYDDTFEPRAFGDDMQKGGTSTLLVESGHAMNDPEKGFIRQLNVVGILTSLYAIATGELERGNIAAYESLPFNGKKAYDMIIRNAVIDHGGSVRTKVDLGISYQVDTHSGPEPLLVDLGDLSTYIALKESDARGAILPASSIEVGKPIEMRQLIQA